MPVEYKTGESSLRNIDPRQLQQFMRSPRFTENLTQEQHQGMQRRVKTAKWTPDMRIVWDAVAEGYTTLDSLPVATGLSDAKIKTALHRLDKERVLKKIEIFEAIPKEPTEI